MRLLALLIFVPTIAWADKEVNIIDLATGNLIRQDRYNDTFATQFNGFSTYLNTADALRRYVHRSASNTGTFEVTDVQPTATEPVYFKIDNYWYRLPTQFPTSGRWDVQPGISFLDAVGILENCTRESGAPLPNPDNNSPQLFVNTNVVNIAPGTTFYGVLVPGAGNGIAWWIQTKTGDMRCTGSIPGPSGVRFGEFKDGFE